MLDWYFLSIHPQFLDGYFQFGAFHSASKQGLASFKAIQLRTYAVDHHGSVDDRPYGGGDSMVMRPEPLRDALLELPKDAHVIMPTPGGKIFDQKSATRLANLKRPLVFVCPRFAGVDQRFVERYVTETFSLGAFVVSGGELPSLMMADAILRQVPGVLGNAESVAMDSFGSSLVDQIEHPVYTRPPEFEGLKVPEALLSGNHSKITAWKIKHSRKVPWRIVYAAEEES